MSRMGGRPEPYMASVSFSSMLTFNPALRMLDHHVTVPGAALAMGTGRVHDYGLPPIGPAGADAALRPTITEVGS